MDDVGSQSSIDDLCLDNISLLGLLAENGDGIVARDQRVEGIDSFPRPGLSKLMMRIVARSVLSEEV